MVNYVFTPWRDRAELFLVRRQFYGSPSQTADRVEVAAPISASRKRSLETATSPRKRQRSETDMQNQRLAIDRVTMWMHKGGCPHMVESTALLFNAVLHDDMSAARQRDDETGGLSTLSARNNYASAMSRYVATSDV